MTNQIQRSEKYDLEERTTKFGIDIIMFAKKLPQNAINSPLITQLVKSGTSIGANYCEADNAESRTDFKHKIGICKKESKETKYWLRVIAQTHDDLKIEARKLWKEAKELNLIFNSIVKSVKRNSKLEIE